MLERGSANVGYQFSPDAETRFYVNANSWRQRLPGELTKTTALTTPRAADPEFVRQDQQRNIDSVRLANKTTLRFGTTTVDFGIFTHQRHVIIRSSTASTTTYATMAASSGRPTTA